MGLMHDKKRNGMVVAAAAAAVKFLYTRARAFVSAIGRTAFYAVATNQLTPGPPIEWFEAFPYGQKNTIKHNLVYSTSSLNFGAVLPGIEANHLEFVENLLRFCIGGDFVLKLPCDRLASWTAVMRFGPN